MVNEACRSVVESCTSACAVSQTIHMQFPTLHQVHTLIPPWFTRETHRLVVATPHTLVQQTPRPFGDPLSRRLPVCSLIRAGGKVVVRRRTRRFTCSRRHCYCSHCGFLFGHVPFANGFVIGVASPPRRLAAFSKHDYPPLLPAVVCCFQLQYNTDRSTYAFGIAVRVI